MGEMTRQQAIEARKGEYIRLGIEANCRKEMMRKEASRFLAAITTLIQSFDFGNKDRWERLRMLRSVARLEYQAQNIQDYVLSTKPMAAVLLLREALSFSDNIQNDVFEKLDLRIDPMMDQLREQIQKAEAVLKASKDGTGEKPELKSDVDIIGMRERLLETFQRILLSIQGFEGSPNLGDGKRRQVKEYSLLFKRLSDLFINAANNNKPKQAKQWYEKFFSAHEMFESFRIQLENELSDAGLPEPPEEPQPIQLDLEKEAGNPVSRWMGRFQTVMFGGESKTIRLSADESVETVRSVLKHLMKELERRNASILDIADSLESLAPALDDMFKKIGRVLENYQSKAALLEAENRSRGKKTYIPKLTYEMRNNIGKASRKMNNFSSKLKEFAALKNRLYAIEKEVAGNEG